MMKSEENDFLTMLAAYQDGGLSEEEIAELESALLNDAEKRRLFAQTQHQSTLIAEHFRSEVFSIEAPRAPTAVATHRTAPKKHPWIIAAIIAMAAAIVLAFVLPGANTKHDAIVSHDEAVKTHSDSDAADSDAADSVQPSADTFATITYANLAHWGAPGGVGNARQSDDIKYLKRDVKYFLTSGSVRLEMKGGAIVSLAAPALFTGKGPTEFELHTGKLAARLPNKESDLLVRSGTTIIRDLGTAFGVTIDGEGDVDLSVFDGSVAVDRIDDPIGIRRQTVIEGESIIAESGSKNNERVSFAAKQYQDLWPLTIGIDEASSLIDFVPPGPISSLKPLATSSKLLLIPEQLNVILGHSQNLVAIGPSRSWPEAQGETIKLSADHSISSYLLVYLPKKRAPQERYSMSGSISFQKPILGVIVQDEPLRKTDRLVGIKKIQYNSMEMRYLEATITEGGQLPADSLRVSEDGKSLYFNLNVGAGQDHLRVLVDEGLVGNTPYSRID